MSGSNLDPAPDPGRGLCPTCAEVREVRSAKGSVFLLCSLAATDPRFGRYPPQPVRVCPGYRRGGSEATDPL